MKKPVVLLLSHGLALGVGWLALRGLPVTAAETFRHAVDARFRNDLAGSVAWGGSLPVGWHREQALAQLAITAETYHHDAATRDAVLAELTNPAIRAEVRECLRTRPSE